MNYLKLLFPILLLLFIACKDDEIAEPELPLEYIGTKVAVGDGMAWSYVAVNDEQVPTSIGVKFDESALQNLPSGSMHPDEFMLPLPDEIEVAPFNHITLDWNEHGHEPPGVYDHPHFDLHFYFMSEAERDAIGPNDTTEFNMPLASEYLASNYLETEGGVPRMGAHIIDLMSPEISGTGSFTHTYIYGKYNGTINFLEPMVTKAYLDEKVDLSQPIRQPAQWQKAGYYPEKYTIEYDPGSATYSILLANLSWQE